MARCPRLGVLFPVFPASNALYPTLPSLRWVAWASLPHLPGRSSDPRYYARLRLPVVLLDALCSRSATDTLLVPFVRVPFPARYRSGTFALTPGLLGLSRYAFSGFFTRKHLVLPSAVLSTVEGFPGYPLELMPCSSTPVVSYTLALSRLGLLPSASLTASAFTPVYSGVYS